MPKGATPTRENDRHARWNQHQNAQSINDVVEHQTKIILVEEHKDRRELDAQQLRLGKLYLIVCSSNALVVALAQQPSLEFSMLCGLKILAVCGLCVSLLCCFHAIQRFAYFSP